MASRLSSGEWHNQGHFPLIGPAMLPRSVKSSAVLFLTLAALNAHADNFRLLAVGDVAQCGVPGAYQTANLLARQEGPILVLGDIAYPKGSREDFQRCFDPAWGRLKARLIPVPGNHEYGTPGAAGYFEYFGAIAGTPEQPWHSRILGNWRVIGLDSNLKDAAATAQLRWLADELAANRQTCVLAYFHHPRFSSGEHGDQKQSDALWRLLALHHTTLVLAGHDHHYERFAPLDGDARPDTQGTRSFVVGTGGAALYPVGKPTGASEFIRNSSWGVLELTLGADDYRWRYLPVDGGPSPDEGSGRCALPVPVR